MRIENVTGYAFSAFRLKCFLLIGTASASPWDKTCANAVVGASSVLRVAIDAITIRVANEAGLAILAVRR